LFASLATALSASADEPLFLSSMPGHQISALAAKTGTPIETLSSFIDDLSLNAFEKRRAKKEFEAGVLAHVKALSALNEITIRMPDITVRLSDYDFNTQSFDTSIPLGFNSIRYASVTFPQSVQWMFPGDTGDQRLPPICSNTILGAGDHLGYSRTGCRAMTLTVKDQDVAERLLVASENEDLVLTPSCVLRQNDTKITHNPRAVLCELSVLEFRSDGQRVVLLWQHGADGWSSSSSTW
jgi:hypothetical protein